MSYEALGVSDYEQYVDIVGGHQVLKPELDLHAQQVLATLAYITEQLPAPYDANTMHVRAVTCPGGICKESALSFLQSLRAQGWTVLIHAEGSVEQGELVVTKDPNVVAMLAQPGALFAEMMVATGGGAAADTAPKKSYATMLTVGLASLGVLGVAVLLSRSKRRSR